MIQVNCFLLLLVSFFWVTVCPRLIWNLLCALGWSWTQRFTVCLLECQAHCFIYFSFFFICLSLYVVCMCAVVEQFQLYILGFASNVSLSFFHYGIVLNSWFSNLRFVCAEIAGVHHHTMLYFDDISSFFSLVTCFCFITTY